MWCSGRTPPRTPSHARQPFGARRQERSSGERGPAGDQSGPRGEQCGGVNGDGIEDRIIGGIRLHYTGQRLRGEPRGVGWDTAGLAPSRPARFRSDLHGTNGFRLDGVAAGPLSGRAVSSARDVNGDGLEDLLLGVADRLAPMARSPGSATRCLGGTPPRPALSASLIEPRCTANGFGLNGVAPGDFSGFAEQCRECTMGSRTSLIGTPVLAAPSYSGELWASWNAPSSPPPPRQPPPPPPPAPRTCNGLPVTIQGTDNGETLIGTPGNDVIDGLGRCDPAVEAATTSLRWRGPRSASAGGWPPAVRRRRPRRASRRHRPRCAERRHGSRPV